MCTFHLHIGGVRLRILKKFKYLFPLIFLFENLHYTYLGYFERFNFCDPLWVRLTIRGLSLVKSIGLSLSQLDRNLLINIGELLSAPAVSISY